MSDDLKTIWDDEHDFEEEDPGDGVPEGAPAPAPEVETVVEAEKTPEQLKAEEEKAKELAEKVRVPQEKGDVVAEVEAKAAEAAADKALNETPADTPAPAPATAPAPAPATAPAPAPAPAAPAEAPKPALDPKTVLSSAFSSIVEDPAKIEGLTKVVNALGNEKLGADYASIPEPTDDFFKKSTNALLHKLLYIARFELTKKKPSEALAADESLTSDANMEKAIALLKEKSEGSEIKEVLQKLDLEAVKKVLSAPGTPEVETQTGTESTEGGFTTFFNDAASGIAQNLIDNVSEQPSGSNSWLNIGGMQNQLLLLVLKLATQLGGKRWYLEKSEADKTILEKRFGLIRAEDATLFEFGKPTDPDYMKETTTPEEGSGTAPAEGAGTPEIKNKDDALALHLIEMRKKTKDFVPLGDLESVKKSNKGLVSSHLDQAFVDAKISAEEVTRLKVFTQILVNKLVTDDALKPFIKDYSFQELMLIYTANQIPLIDLKQYEGSPNVGEAVEKSAAQTFQVELAKAAATAGEAELAKKVELLDLV